MRTRTSLFRVPFGCGEIQPQFVRRAARSVPGRVALDAPAFLQRPGIHGVEPELIEQMRDRGLGSLIVAGNDEGTSVRRAGGLSVRGELRGVDVVERLHDPCTPQV